MIKVLITNENHKESGKRFDYESNSCQRFNEEAEDDKKEENNGNEVERKTTSPR